MYYENGNLMYEIEYVNGLKNGIERIYSDTGELKSTNFYKNGKKV